MNPLPKTSCVPRIEHEAVMEVCRAVDRRDEVKFRRLINAHIRRRIAHLAKQVDREIMSLSR